MSGITSVEIESFRCFERLRVEGLTPVNLIVGKNNAGKTALLEAIEAAVSENSPFVLYRASFERGEFRRRNGSDEKVELDISHWFHGHRVDEGSTFSVRGHGDRERWVSRTVQRVPADAPSPSSFAAAGLMLTIDRPASGAQMRNLPLAVDGFLGAGAPTTFVTFGHHLPIPVGFITTDRLVSPELARLWSTVVLTPAEDRTVEALRIVAPEIHRFAISENNGTASARILLRGARAPIPLGTLGEGVSRILALALHLSVVQGGFLFIDEIESGLHWSVMPKVWRFLVETAQTLNVQVFATTHSKDCLEGLAELHRTDSALAERVSVHRLEAGRDTSVRFDADRIAEYVEMELEAR